MSHSLRPKNGNSYGAVATKWPHFQVGDYGIECGAGEKLQLVVISTIINEGEPYPPSARLPLLDLASRAGTSACRIYPVLSDGNYGPQRTVPASALRRLTADEMHTLAHLMRRPDGRSAMDYIRDTMPTDCCVREVSFAVIGLT